MPEYELHSYQWWGRFFETAACQATSYKLQRIIWQNRHEMENPPIF